MSGEQLTVATLNTRGIPVTGSRLADRYAVIGAGFDAGDVDVAGKSHWWPATSTTEVYAPGAATVTQRKLSPIRASSASRS